jgi:hypothetical protein
LANLRITGGVKGVGEVLFALTPLPLTFWSYLQFLFLLWCPSPFSFFLLLLFLLVRLFDSILCQPQRGGS